MPRLSAAHFGYNHQDCVTAYAFAVLLLPRFDNKSVIVDRKVVANDRFDDLEIVSAMRQRVQIKSREVSDRPLQLIDFTTNHISFRIDEVVRSFVDDRRPADEYRLFTSFDSPEAILLPFLRQDPQSSPLLPGLATQRYKLNPASIWPDGNLPKWPHIESFGRDVFEAFCDRFVVEINCPRASGDLRNPGPLEQALFTLLHDRIGLGIWPNHNRDLADATAHLIQAASVARANSATYDQQSVIETLALRIDYGRVEENFPVDKNRLVPQTDTLKELSTILAANPRVAVTGSPGIGKSWLLYQFASHLSSEGWTVASHYCFIDLFDTDRTRRASVETVFGSILAQLLDKDPSLSTDTVPRYAAGPHELEKLLEDGIRENPDRQIAIIVDGLDHADRLPDNSQPGLAIEIVQELAAMRIPSGVAIVIGSQPGDHSHPFLTLGIEYRARRWSDEAIRILAKQMGVGKVLDEQGLEGEYDHIQGVITNKAAGNPLYATYLGRTVITIAQQSDPGSIYDIAEYLTTAPTLDQNLDAYYQWLFHGLARDTGAIWIGELLSLIDFPLSADEIKQIRSEFRHHVDNILSHLSPILVEDVTHGGVRIYHESFQRYMSLQLEADPDADIAVILKPVIEWLNNRGFFSDIRAFRSLLKLLKKAGRDEEVIARITDDYVANAIAYGQPADAAQANLAIAAAVAATYQSWPILARFIELSRATYHFYQWRLDDHSIAEQYGRTYSALNGPRALSVRLLHDGRCTFPPRPGLVLCKMCDDEGITPPWVEYREAHDIQRRKDNTMYSKESDVAIQIARLTGRFRINGREQSIHECIHWLNSPNNHPVHPEDIAWTVGDMYGADALIEVINSLQSGLGRSWAHLALALMSENQEESKRYAENALSDGLPPEGWRSCLELGVDPQKFPRGTLNLHNLTMRVASAEIQFHEETLSRWLTAIQLADALEDEIQLLQAELNIPSDFWFHKWLRFCLVLIRSQSTQDEILSALIELSQNIDVFEGKPRACDLYGLHDEIRGSFHKALSFLDNDHWQDALNALKQISIGTSTWLQGARTGPLPLDEFFELCLSTANTEEKRRISSALGRELLTPKNRGGEYYDTHAQDQLLLTRLYLAASERDSAEKAWREACLYLSSYGEHKDITVYELLDPLEALVSVDPQRVRRCFFDVQPVVERILIHTDGKETDHAIHKWLDIAASAHPAGALSYLTHYGIERIPSFGDLDHAIPHALATLEGQINPFLQVAGWIAAGSEARSNLPAALSSCENAFRVDPDLGRTLWNVVVGCLDGDGFDPPDELQTLSEESATRVGLAAPYIEKTPSQKKTKANNYLENPSPKDQNSNPVALPVFPTITSPIHIAHGIRIWRDSRGHRVDLVRVTNAVGWRLMEMVDAGDESLAESFLRQIARDLPAWDAEDFLPYIADGLALHGALRLAALASTLAYTRARDGWRSFAGPKGIRLFTKAIELDPLVAWSTLADEVSNRVAQGGDYGVNAHLVELLQAGGRVDEAFDTWASACKSVVFRVPYTGPRDDIDIPYDYENNSPAAMIATVIFTRINHCFLHEKRLAVAAAALVISLDPVPFGSALKYALTNNIPSSTLITLLQLMDLYEPEPYPATQIVREELRVVAVSNLISARVLARRLLERAGLEVPIQPAMDLPFTPAISEERTSVLIKWIGESRVRSVEKIWPEFGQRVTEYVDVRLKSEELKERMQHALRRIDTDRKKHNLQVWLPTDEEVENAVQITGATVRTEMARNGILDPNIEEAVGLRLLGNMDISIRLMLSRMVRPKYLPKCLSLQPGWSVTEPISVPDGEFAGWIILAHYETELVIGDDYDKPVVGKIRVYSCLQFDTGWHDEKGLPLGYGHLAVWYSKVPSLTVHVPFHGPLVGISFTRDMYGMVHVLVPHPIVQVASRLVPTQFDRGLTLNDKNGNPAVVCRYWRQRLISTLYRDDQEPRIEGMLTLARPDVFGAISAYTIEPAIYVTYADNEHGTED